MKTTTAQLDRCCGALLATAAGDALGAGYESGAPPAPGDPVEMIGGGEWTDDTAMAVAIAEAAATGADLRDEHTQDTITGRWQGWAPGAEDIGAQTRSVLSGAARRGTSARSAREEAAALHENTGRTAGNGSLMRTAPVALAYLDDETALPETARAISGLTHHDPEAGDACVLWCAAIRHAVRAGELDARVGLHHIPLERRDLWASRLREAESSPPSAFASNNGWVVAALQAAWSAIITTAVPDEDPASGVFAADHLRLALEAAVRGGGAAIAGGLLGAAYGASAVPWHWRRALHGWPGLNTRGLVALADAIFHNGEPGHVTYPDYPPRSIRHPHDDKVWIGGLHALQNLPADVDAIVSLCRVPDEYLPDGVEQLDVRLIDTEGENAHLDFVLLDTVRAIEGLRTEGRTVFVHCVQAHSRTPAVAALYGSRRGRLPVDEALADVLAVLPGDPNRELHAALHRLRPAATT